MKVKVFYSTAFLLCLFLNSFGQKNEFDSLNKYSYFIEGVNFKTNIIATGTGFFIRNNKNDIYLITAKHVLTGCYNSFVKNKEIPNAMNVFLDNKGTMISLDVSIIKDTATCLALTDSPDFIAIKIDNKWSKYINSVEKFIEPKIKKAGITIVSGYPFRKNIELGFFRITPPTQILIQSCEYVVYDSAKNAYSGKIDSLNYKIHPQNSSLVDSITPGFSGSPLFLQDKESKNIQIVGILVGTAENANGTFKNIVCLKIKYILDDINYYQYLNPIESR